MSTATHTPGPWIAHKDASPKNHWVEADNRHHFTIIQHLGCEREAAANAALIAAAPDLLAALRRLHALSGQLIDEPSARIAKALALSAIYKATETNKAQPKTP